MPISIYNNTTGFRPKGDLLKLWAMLPQVTSYIGQHKIPSLFGNPKSVRIPIIMVILLVAIEGVLVFQLNEEGVGFLAILAISIFDFVIAILPPEILMRKNLVPADIEANIFVNEQRLQLPAPIGADKDYKGTLDRKVQHFERKRKIVNMINISFVFILIGLNIWKFFIYFGVLGDGIFVEPIGRFILTVILLSIIVHIFYTKIVYIYWRYTSEFSKQHKDFTRKVNYFIPDDEINKSKEIEFSLKYKPAFSANQRIAQRILLHEQTDPDKERIMELPHDSAPLKYRVSDFIGTQNIHIVFTGLLTDPEIQGLYSVQDAGSREAILVTCKEIQIDQNQ